MLDQRHRAGWGVEVPWGPGALAEVRGCRRDSEARTPVTLVIPPTAGSCWPDHPDLVAVLEAGLVAVDVPHDIDFADPGRTLEAAHFLCLLRDCTGLGVPVRWGGTGADATTVESLGHLHPPSRPLSGSLPGPVAAWRRSFRPGRLSWRRGPGFVTVDDRRTGRQRRIVIGDARLLTAFGQLAAPVWEASGTAPERAAIAHLVASDLTVQVGPWLLHTPHRMRP